MRKGCLGVGVQPGPEVIDAAGDVGFFAALEPGRILLLGGNQLGHRELVPKRPAARGPAPARLTTSVAPMRSSEGGRGEGWEGHPLIY